MEKERNHACGCWGHVSGGISQAQVSKWTIPKAVSTNQFLGVRFQQGEDKSDSMNEKSLCFLLNSGVGFWNLILAIMCRIFQPWSPPPLQLPCLGFHLMTTNKCLMNCILSQLAAQGVTLPAGRKWTLPILFWALKGHLGLGSVQLDQRCFSVLSS